MTLFTLCIEGTKGAGKSTTIKRLAQRLEQTGFFVEVSAPFTAANAFAVTKGFSGAAEWISASAHDNRLEIDFIRAAMAEAKARAATKAATEGKPVVLIYDRGWMTIRPHLFGGRWCVEEGADNEAIRRLWDQVLAEAPPTVFLHASFEITRQRRSRPDRVGKLDTDEKLREDVEGRAASARACGKKIVLSFDTGETAQDEIVAAIADYIGTRIRTPQPGGRPEP